MIEVLTAFFGMVLLDIVFGLYVIKASEHQMVQAGSYASAILVLNAVVTLAYIDNRWMIIPAMIGAFVGTVLAIKIDEWSKR